MSYTTNLAQLKYLSQFSNAVLSQNDLTKITHYKVGSPNKSSLILPLKKVEKLHRKKWSKNQLEKLKTTESKAVMSCLIKEHSE